ncbi:leucyl aminopeptidase [Vallicoccus soli]|uniref:Probable cytosol aminopeptidase n=1 Tax=Vallicoccus soli TaxID=2339232 RepID=A0A3A3ZND0_9ACTN|nr:leucyl aminopeptidase [Vallicoccus soli]
MVWLRPGDDGPVLDPAAAGVGEALGVDLADEAARAGARGSEAEVNAVPVRAEGVAVEVVLLAGAGDGTPRALRRAGAALARRARGRRALAAALPEAVEGPRDEAARALGEGLALAAYAFPRRGTTPPQPGAQGGALGRLLLVERGAAEPLRRAAATARAVATARDLANTPADVEDPAWLAARAGELLEGAGVALRVRDEAELAEEGFGGVLAVGAGSARPPRLLEMAYEPEGAGRRTPHVVLVGKGITFDSGGLSLKPREAMVPMKTDMAAGGAVVAVMTALAELGVTARVTALVPAAENLPGASAMRPGDVVTHYGGRTVEVLNTDAEGRLVLADALAYADAVLDPDVVVDIATLTGAASLGLGRRHGALYSGDDDLAAALVAAGVASGDALWRMPLVEDYRRAMDSPVADLSNISRDSTVSGGSITAALFLREFAGGRRWAHLDVAGPARADGDEHEVTKGGTGFGTRVLLRWLEGLGGGRRRR